MSYSSTHFLSLCALSATLALGASTQVVAQNKLSDANVVGHVIEAKTGEHLPGITIGIKGSTFGAATDVTGHYTFRHLTPGRHTIFVRGLGYRTQEREITVEAGKTIEVNFTVEPDDIRIDEVVVSANRQATLRRQAPTLVNVEGGKTFEAANANNLAQGLVFQPGVRVENNCQNCGFNQVRINGLDGRYAQILIDSRPVMSALAGVYGLEQIPTNMIDRVEVVRGGGSALFGSSAIAGVVNIITKEPSSNSASFTESLGFTGFKSLDNNLSFNASVVTDDGRAGAMLFGQSRYRKEHDVNGDGYSELGRLDGRSLGMRAYLRTSDLSKLTAEMHSMSEARRGGDHLDWPDHVAGVSESVRHSVWSGNLRYDLFSRSYADHLQLYASAQYVRRDSYYGGIGEPTAKDQEGNPILIGGKPVPAGRVGYPISNQDFGINNGLSKGLTWVGGAQYTHDFKHLLFMPAQLLLGLEYMQDRLDDTMPIRHWYTTDYLEGRHGGSSTSPDINQRIGNFSQFAQLEWKNERWSFLVGTRLDQHSEVKGAILSPRATLRYNPTSNLNLRATYAKGFRAPQVFDEDLHVGVVNGEAQRIYNAQGLKPEISHSFSLSSDMYFRFGSSTSLNLLVEGFYTRLQDVFTNNLVSANDRGLKVYERNNYGKDAEGNLVASGAKILGANLEARLSYRWLQLQAGLTLASNRYDAEQEWGVRNAVQGIADEDQSKYLSYVPAKDGADFVTEVNEDGEASNVSMTSRHIMRTPSVYGYFTVGINPTKALNLSLTGTYTGRMYVPHAVVWGGNTAVTDRNAIAAGLRTEGFAYAPTRSGVAVPDAEEIAPQWDELKRSPAFFDLGARVSYDFSLFNKTKLQLFAGVSNLFGAFQSDYDFGPDRDSAYIYGPTMPASGYMGLKFSF